MKFIELEIEKKSINNHHHGADTGMNKVQGEVKHNGSLVSVVESVCGMFFMEHLYFTFLFAII